ncbi:hypothetical protein BJX70DRAFT_375269 [Aspergillus crustosus]
MAVSYAETIAYLLLARPSIADSTVRAKVQNSHSNIGELMRELQNAPFPLREVSQAWSSHWASLMPYFRSYCCIESGHQYDDNVSHSSSCVCEVDKVTPAWFGLCSRGKSALRRHKRCMGFIAATRTLFSRKLERIAKPKKDGRTPAEPASSKRHTRDRTSVTGGGVIATPIYPVDYSVESDPYLV